MRRVFKTRGFVRLMRKSGLRDADLCKAVTEMEQGLIDADLGGAVLKKRVALPGKGKSGSARTLVATNRSGRWFFLYGFEKKDRANISGKELEGLQCLAADLLKRTATQLDTLVGDGALEEICNGNEA